MLRQLTKQKLQLLLPFTKTGSAVFEIAGVVGENGFLFLPARRTRTETFVKPAFLFFQTLNRGFGFADFFGRTFDFTLGTVKIPIELMHLDG